MKTPREIRKRIRRLKVQEEFLDAQGFTMHSKMVIKGIEELKWVLK